MVTGELRPSLGRGQQGEILVFDCGEGEEEGEVRSRITIRPHQTVGCWYNSSYLISSDHDWLNSTVSTNKFWINKVHNCLLKSSITLMVIWIVLVQVDLRLDSDPGLACMRQLYRFYNSGAGWVREVAVCPVHPAASREGWGAGRGGGLASSDPDTALAAYLTLLEQRCLLLVRVPPLPSTPALPPGTDSQLIKRVWEGEYVVDWEEGGADRAEQLDRDQELQPILWQTRYHQDRWVGTER